MNKIDIRIYSISITYAISPGKKQIHAIENVYTF